MVVRPLKVSAPDNTYNCLRQLASLVMAIPKVCGIETEYGITHRGVPEPNPIEASSLLIRAYLAAGTEASGLAPDVAWDFSDESPFADARGATPQGALAPPTETHLVNAVLTNGARYYVDHAHPEISTPECVDALSVVLYDRAAELIAIESMAAAKRLLPDGQELVVHKNNSDGKGNSYGCHENYLLDRHTPFDHVVHHATAHFISRQIYTGSGKVGSEMFGQDARDVPFQLTQRADFFEERVGLETTLKRPIINTRDEPHADARKYRRLHVIVGDANMSQVATFLKVGVTNIVLAMIEDDYLDNGWEFVDPVRALQSVSTDLSLQRPLELSDGSRITALDIQWQLFASAQRYISERGAADVGGDVAVQILDRWESVLARLENDPMQLADQIDWVAKYRLLDGYATRHDVGWEDPRLAAMALQFHDLRPERSIFNKLGMETLVDEGAARQAAHHPPEDTRAYFRGECLRRWPDNVVSANWDSLVFDIDGVTLRRVPMNEPLRGTRAHVGTLLDECETADDLLARLDSAGNS